MKSISKYTLCISDLMMGLLFIFILLLVKHMSEYQQKKTQLLDPLNARAQLVEEIGKEMKNYGIKANVDSVNGILSLRDISYFDQGKYKLEDISDSGVGELKKIRSILQSKIICYSNKESFKNKWKKKYPRYDYDKWDREELEPLKCNEKNKSESLVESILIEGHADSTPLGRSLKKEGLKDNIDLAMKRSQTVFRFFTKYKEGARGAKEDGNYLYLLSNQEGKPLFGMTSYGNLRRESLEESIQPSQNPPDSFYVQKELATDAHRSPSSKGNEDRRIDIRFIMAQPQEIKEELNKSFKKKGLSIYAK